MESTRPFVQDRIDRACKNLSPHETVKGDEWFFALFKGNDIQFKKGPTLNDQLEKYFLELGSDAINHRSTTPLPKKYIYTNNVILNIGLQESIDRDINVSSTSLSHGSLGTSATAEAVTQTDLQAELTDAAYARLPFDSTTRVNQTMVLALLWDDTSLDATPTTIREAGIHWHVSNASSCHARAIFSDFSFDAGDIFVVRATELHQNGSL